MCTQNFVLIFASILYLSHHTSSEIITCDGLINTYCGPCTSTDICNLQCLGRDEVCLESKLSCTEGTACRVDCASLNACSDAIINAPASTSVMLNCHELTSCDTTTLIVANNADVVVNCGGSDGGCKDLTLNAQFAGNVVVNCIGFKSCNGIHIYCGNGDCDINCIESSGAVCSGVSLQCGSGQCSIDCTTDSGPEKCDSSTLNQIDTTKAQKFECIGSPVDCFNAPAPFVNPTVSPTVITTKYPSITPTKTTAAPPSITEKPSVHPISKPTVTPTSAPTSKPTNIPTSGPTFRPTLRPTPIPTATTRNPTPIPSVRPSISPSKHPTKTGQTLSPSDEPSKHPTPSPTLLPSDEPTGLTTKTGDTVSPTKGRIALTRRPTVAVQTNVITSSISIAPTETIITTPSPTYDQSDEAECCHCLKASNSTSPVPGCAVDPECEVTICNFDGFCCNDHWDKTCVFYASEQCEKTTPRTTLNATVVNEEPNLDLVWKLALVVFALMIMFVSCCCVIIRIKTWCRKWYKTHRYNSQTEDLKKSNKEYHEVVVDGDDVEAYKKGPKLKQIPQDSVLIGSERKKRKQYIVHSVPNDGLSMDKNTTDDTKIQKKRFVTDTESESESGESEESEERKKKKKRKRKTKTKTKTKKKRKSNRAKRSSRRKRAKKKKRSRKRSSDTSRSIDDGDDTSEGLSSSIESDSDSDTDLYSGEELGEVMKRMSSVATRHSI